MRKILVLCILLSALIIVLARSELFFDGGREDGIETSPPAVAERSDTIPPSAPEPADSVAAKHGSIPRRGSFFVEMQRAGIDPAQIQRIVAAARGVFDFRKVRPGQKYTIYTREDGTLDSLEYRASRDKILLVERTGDGFRVKTRSLGFETIYRITSGVIDQSLFVSLQEQGADEDLAASLAEIFGWVIDFFRDIRRGDSYTILYRKKVYQDGYSETGEIVAAKIVNKGKPHFAFRYTTQDGKTGYFDQDGKSLEKSLLRTPLRYTRITSSFRWRRSHPITRAKRPHLGVDYAAPYGTPVHATGDGVVITAARNSANGKYIKIRHNTTYTTYYLHLSRFARGIRRGARVVQGQVIGYVGSTGYATGPHLDYRIKVNGRFVNPRTVRLPSKKPVPAAEMALFERQRDLALEKFLEAPETGTAVMVEKPVPRGNGRMEVLF